MRTVAATIVLVIIALAGLSGPAAATPRNLFGSNEMRGENLGFFPQFVDMLQRYAVDLNQRGVACSGSAQVACALDEWAGFITSVQGLDPRSQIERVNRYVNEVTYVEDNVNWGKEDYWATPAQFFVRAGDCEDYAIAKYMTLRSLGFPIDSMRIVVLMDTNLGIGHAVLAVYVGDDVLVLDNQISQVVSESSIHHYQPVYSLNEHNWWRHR